MLGNGYHAFIQEALALLQTMLTKQKVGFKMPRNKPPVCYQFSLFSPNSVSNNILSLTLSAPTSSYTPSYETGYVQNGYGVAPAPEPTYSSAPGPTYSAVPAPSTGYGAPKCRQVYIAVCLSLA